MDAFVLLKRTELRETLLAQFASVRLLAGMNAHVLLVALLAGKEFTTICHITFKLLSRLRKVFGH